MINDMKYTYEFLRKCHGLRFKATINNKPQEGIIKVMSDCIMFCLGDEDYGRLFTFERRDTLSLSAESFRLLPSDFEIVPRDPETYKDWQVGDKVESMLADPGGEVIFRSGRLVVLDFDDGWAREAFTCNELAAYFRLVLTDIEKQILEERKKEVWKPQDGDICYAQTMTTPQRFIFIEGHRQYMLVDLTNSGYELDTDKAWKYSYIRLATDEEKQQLFDALAKAGKRWNAEKKCLEDISVPYELKEGDLVLARINRGGEWKLRVFKGRVDGSERQFKASVDGFLYIYQYGIPYNEETKHLLGTTDDYEEGER